MNWAEWAPTIVSAGVGVFSAGVTVGLFRATLKRQDRHEERLDGHDDEFKNLGGRVSEMEGWRDAQAYLGRV